MFGKGHYCDTTVDEFFPNSMVVTSPTAEVAILNNDHTDFDNDFLKKLAYDLDMVELYIPDLKVFQNVTPDNLYKIIKKLENLF